ncbi:hypothetical protein NDN08_001081 [Rhodosorus marinus]|uniref:Brix domain-containing protein n=1 Tax=Rhodosorus marinus TaxID=101924 RepID=A0AAV8UPX3_9RHOD|nr:hypothetical protein NDN08_001081 [Rhodosorus marinus]
MPRKKGRRRKRRTHVVDGGEEGADGGRKIPRSFVIRRGELPVSLKDLVPDMRRMFMPHTALHLKERKKGKMKDYFGVAGRLGISHFWLVSCTERGAYLRVGKYPRGPTLTFHLEGFSLSKDVKASQRRPISLESNDMKEPPLLVLNNFTNGPDHVKIMATVFENMFPKLDVKNVALSNVRRVILVDYDSHTETVSIRHFLLRATLAGLSKPVRSIVVRHKIPHLKGLKDISQIAEEGGTGFVSSDSEGEGPEESQVNLPQNLGKTKRKGGKTTLRLREVGPRLTMKLVKVEELFCEGKVFYHAYIHRSADEVYEMQRRHDVRKEEKALRRKVQEENVKRKQLAKQKRKGANEVGDNDEGDDDDDDVDADDVSEDADSDVEYAGKRKKPMDKGKPPRRTRTKTRR